ncbi:MAG TPA: metal ABC transporter ATP-binding protein [Terriglobia bacterium]|nr:metal ABC transporter ATP-binding protein [Terriglobia bacterium]
MTNPILTVRDLEIGFQDRSIIRDLNFQLSSGECLAIIGPNGCGKTTLLKALMRLLPYRGKIQWRPDVRLGYVPQRVSSDRQLPLSVRDLLEAKARLLKVPVAEVQRVAQEIELVPELLKSRLGILSGGQFQKVLIAFALLGRPNVLLFDEPTASFDELTEERIYALLRSLQIEKGITVILVSHDLSVVYRYANIVLCLNRDHPCLGPPQEVLTPEALEELYSAPARYHKHIQPSQH